jgi:hypothetical protein
MFTPKIAKNPKIYNCEKCNLTTSNKNDFNKHLLTRKHKNTDECLQENLKKSQKKYTCELCQNEYIYRQSLYTHKKKCILYYKNNEINDATDMNHLDEINKNHNNNNNSEGEIQLLTNLVLDIVKSNKELQKQMIDLCKNSNNNNTTNHINNNSNNKTFNLQFFLNEQCKDAMNMSEFIASIQLQISDLENVGKLGYTEGIYKIIQNEIVDMETFKRPIHCSDLKRETLYIKDENKWEKEGPDNKKMKNALRHIEQKNLKMLNEWQLKHPHFKECTSPENDTYLQIVSQATNGTPENMNKVIKKVLKNIVIEKD